MTSDKNIMGLHGHKRAALMFGLALCLLFAMWLVRNANLMLVDPDTAWHIKVGEDIWAAKQFPVSDTYSYSFSGAPWIAKEWLSQILLASGFDLAGWNGVAALAAIAILALGATVYLCAAQHLKPAISVVLTLLAMGAARSSFLARPHLFALPLSVYFAYLLFEDARAKRGPRWWLLALLILWANLHSSFTIGWAFAGLALLEYCEATRLGDRQTLFKWVGFVALCPIVSLVHPYGYQAALMTYAVTSGNEATMLLEEWLPFNAHTHIAALAALLIFIGTCLASGARLSISRAIAILLLTYLFLSYGRFASLMFTLAPLLAAPALASALPQISMQHWTHQPLDRSETFMAKHFKVLAVAGCSALLLMIGGLSKLTSVQRDPSLAVESAIAFAKSLGLSGPVLNSYNLGGALIQNGIATYIDGRSDQLFQGGFFRNDMRTQLPGAKAVLDETLKRHGIAWTLLSVSDPRVGMLDTDAGWRRAFADQNAVIHVRQAGTP